MKPQKSILIVDDEATLRRVLEVALTKAGYCTRTAENAIEALRQLEEESFDLVISDVTMPGMNGYQFQKQLKQRFPNVPIILVTAYGTIQHAVSSMREGAFDFLTKPVDLEQLKKVVKCALEATPTPARASKSPAVQASFVAESEEMKQIVQTVHQVAESRASVLITGESGTGKEVIARMLHDKSSRAGRPFVACSCAALPETLLESELFGYEKGAFTGAVGAKAGRFEMADGGTLFLDEIGEVPLTIQAKLLRALQEREIDRLGSTKSVKVDVRLVTATNRNLVREVDAGNFRLDLLYRLQVVEIAIPALRHRKDDILPLARFFLAKHGEENGRGELTLSAEAERALLAYSWPGNVRELGNAIERAVVLCGPGDTSLDAKMLPQAVLAA